MCQQAGFENTVAVSGTALTSRHLNTLKRYTDNLLLSFDMDVAGDTATKRGINLAESQGFNIKIIDTYSGAKDPAEIILENPENWDKSVKNARTIMDFYFDSTFAKFDKKDPKGKKEIGKIILPAIKRLQNKIEQSHWIQKLSEKLGVSQDSVLEELKSTKIENISQSLDTVPVQTVGRNMSVEGRKKLLEDKIVSLVLKNPENLNLIEEAHHCLFCDKTKSLIENIKASASKRGNDPEAIFADIPKDEYKELLDMLALKAEINYDEDGLDEIQLCISQLKDIELINRMNELSGALKGESDEQKKGEIIEEFTKKAKELHQKI
ncbi:MAG: toprim domain-containing protein [Candidatus Staskawiczbacteria bacterium]|nr:toprim domain-containing protein [Candidatus Staskawiczbacteria bacterium]